MGRHVESSDSKLARCNQVDQVKAFMLFTLFGGDAEKTAQACAVDVELINSLAHDFHWLERIKGQNRMDTDEGMKLEQQANRARNYVLAQRLSVLLEHIVLGAAKDPEAWAAMHCTDIEEVYGPNGEKESVKTFTSKPLVEIAKAAQIIQDMTYRATGDRLAAQASTTEANEKQTTNLMINVYAGLDKLKQTAEKMAKVIDPNTTIVLDAVTNHDQR